MDLKSISGEVVKDVQRVTVRQSVVLPVSAGSESRTTRLTTFNGLSDAREHIAMQFGPLSGKEAPLVRVHSECLTGDVFASLRCDCGPQLRDAIDELHRSGGILLYLRQEGRGIGLYAKLDAYVLQDDGLDTYEANRELKYGDDLRDYRCAAEMLQALGVSRVRLLTNNPDKVRQIISGGIDVVEWIRTRVHANPHNHAYLMAKVRVGRHRIEHGDLESIGVQRRSGDAGQEAPFGTDRGERVTPHSLAVPYTPKSF